MTGPVFADTSFWVALRLPRDQHHGVATNLLSNVSRPIVTTNHVIGETWTAMLRAGDHERAIKFIRRIRDSKVLTVRHVTPSIERSAWKWLERHDERRYSFVDATSFALMRELDIRETLSFDGDFTAAGFVELRA